jgi:ATP-dependent protease ClpP protease subunit
LTGDIEEESIRDIIEWILYENMEERPTKVLTLYINSYGGDMNQAFALIDVMNCSRYPIATVGIGAVP